MPSKVDKLPLSVSIISFEEQHNIARTLESVTDIAAEIVVVDSHSTDDTRLIAADFGARVFDEDWKGHVRQKNSALQKCTQDWILALDCDEVVTPILKKRVVAALQGAHPTYSGYRINRRSVFLGRELRYAWQPDWKLRLVRRDRKPAWTGYDPHDVLTVAGEVARLKGDLTHYSYEGIEDLFLRQVKYARIAASSYGREGRRFHFYNLLFNPPFTFLKSYLLQLGLLDGLPGLCVAVSSFSYVFLKYLFLWDMEKNAHPKR